jgi:diguanylate cyclase (GGDEF)-like protein
MQPLDRPRPRRQDPLSASDDEVSDPAFMSRVLALLLVAGGTLGLVSMLLPQPPGTSYAGTYAVIAGTYALAATVLVLYRRAPRLTPSLTLAGGTVLVTLGTLATGQPTSPYPLFYVWIGLSAFYFLGAREAIAHVLFIAACYAALLVHQSAPGGAERWLIVMGTVGVAALAMHYMRARLEGLVLRLREAVDGLAAAARTDPLTGLVNRRGFTELVEVELERARRSRQPLSLVSADLDGFKAVNARLGHPVGDAFLQRTARVFERTRRRIDGLARTGGEEFAVLLPHTREREAYVMAERLRVALEREFAGEPVSLTMSLGVATAPRDADKVEPLVSAADQSLDVAKRMGRNRTVLFSPEVVKMIGESPVGPALSREAQLAPLFKLAEALDLRDTGTAEHSQVVGQYAEMMAHELGFEPPAVERVGLAGVLHDVGKIGVRDTVLRKPGMLTESECAEMRRHPEIGARLLGDETPDIRAWVLAHHERPDGNGYPRGLKGDEIPLEARILAVADAFEAMTADRVYRPAIDSSQALAELHRCAGAQFDAEVVAAFTRALDAKASAPRPATDPPLTSDGLRP